jgi:hypothetical protein
MWETVSMQSCVSPDALVALAAIHALSLVLFAFYSLRARRRMPTAEHTASASSGADSADAEVAALETALAHARQRAAAAAAAARALTPADAETTAEADADAETTADSADDDDAEEYEVEAIISTTRACDDRSASGGGKAHEKADCKCERKYLVKWKGYDAEGDNTWEPEERLIHNAKDALTAFKVARKVPPYHQPSRSSSRSSSNASQTAAAAAAATANATAAAAGAIGPAPAGPMAPITQQSTAAAAPPPAPTASAAAACSTPRPDATLNGHSDDRCAVWDVRGDGRCCAYCLAICDGDTAISRKRANEVYSRTADELQRCPPRYAATIASEDGGDAKAAVAKRAATLRTPNCSHHMTLTDISAYGALCAYRIAVVAINSASDKRADTNTTYYGYELADRTGVLILVGRHYRVMLPRDRSAGNTFARDAIDHALGFARAHALAWHLEGTTAPQYPTQPQEQEPVKQLTVKPDASAMSYAAAAGASAPDPTAATPNPPAARPTAKPAAPADTGATGSTGHTWRVQKGRIRYANKLKGARTAVITCTPPASGITEVEQRLQAISVTLSSYADRYTIASNGALHVQAKSVPHFGALIDTAVGVRRMTHKTGLILIEPLKVPTQQPGANAPTKAPTKPSVKPKPALPSVPIDDRHSPRARARSSGDRKSTGGSRGHRRTHSPAPDHRSTRATDESEAMRQVHRMQRELNEQMRHMHDLFAKSQRQPLAQSTDPPQPRARRSSPTCDRVSNRTADEFAAFKRFEAFQALVNPKPAKVAGAATKRDSSRQRKGDDADGDDANSDADTAHAHGTAYVN